jgi:hypothetical protein
MHAIGCGALNCHADCGGALKEAQALYRSSGYREVPAFSAEPSAHHWFEKAL